MQTIVFLAIPTILCLDIDHCLYVCDGSICTKLWIEKNVAVYNQPNARNSTVHNGLIVKSVIAMTVAQIDKQKMHNAKDFTDYGCFDES